MKKGIAVKQRDMTDCGAACLASVAAYYGLRIPVSRVRQYAGTDKQGTSLYGMMEAAQNLNFQVKGAKAGAASVSGIPLPAVFHQTLETGLQHFVVVYKIKKQRVWLMDPGHGKMIYQSLEAFKKSWSGVILILLPAENFKRGNEVKPAFVRFWQLIQPHRSMIWQALLGAFIYTLLGLSMSVYVQKIIDFVLPDANKNLMNSLGLAMIVLLCFQVIIGYMKSGIALRTGQQIDTRLILGYYRHLLDLPQRFFDSMRVGEIISRVTDALRIRIFINDVALNVLVNMLTMLLSITAMFMYYWKLAIGMILTVPVYILIYWISNRVNAKWQRKMMETSAALENQLVESIQGVATIRRFGAQEYFNLKTENRFIPLMRNIYISSRAGLKIASATEWITSLLTILILWVGSYLVIDQQLSPGELLSFYTLTAFFTSPVQAIIGANRPMQDALIAADRLFEIIDLETEKEPGEFQSAEVFPAGDMVFRNVHFSYGPGNAVFSGLNLTIPKFQITAIVGESGCGKSTVLALLQRFYPLNSGQILIGDMDIKYISPGVLRHRIAAVPQHTDLFEGTIISNIALGHPEPDLQKIFDICYRLGLHEFIDQLPARYQTIISEQGNNFSGGQKQRLAIARALYRDPDILVLDEATSALDPESDRKVQETIRWFHERQKTILVIAHRLSTVKLCDSIIFIKVGLPAQCGTHENLLNSNAEYAGWWNLYKS